MLSFVVQNFYDKKSQLTRTKKYVHLAKLYSADLFFLFIKSNLGALFYKQLPIQWNTAYWRLYRKHLITPFWTFLEPVRNYRYGLLTNNLTKSLSYHTINILLSTPNTLARHNVSLPNYNGQYVTAYTQHIPTVSLALHKKLYDTTVVYILRLLVMNYVPTRVHFKLNYAFIMLPENFNLYIFCNLFYFKIRNH